MVKLFNGLLCKFKDSLFATSSNLNTAASISSLIPFSEAFPSLAHLEVEILNNNWTENSEYSSSTDIDNEHYDWKIIVNACGYLEDDDIPLFMFSIVLVPCEKEKTEDVKIQTDGGCVIESMPLGLLQANRDMKIIRANSVLETVVGISADKLIGTRWIELLEPKWHLAALNVWNEVCEKSERREMKFQIKRGNETRWITSFVGPVKNDVTLIIISFCDTTYQVETEEALARSNGEMRILLSQTELALHAKNQFFASVSHEIRTPLNAIIGMGVLLNETRLNDEQRFFTATIVEQGQFLSQLINDILLLAKIESDIDHTSAVVLKENTVDLVELSESILHSFQVEAKRKNLQLEYQWKLPKKPFWATADAGRLRQILMNLIANAIKFTSSGRVALIIDGFECTADSDDTTEKYIVDFNVEDTGIGIDPQDLKKLFQPFARIDMRTEGTGLGLTIGKRFADILGGYITTRSEPGKGSIFTLRLKFTAKDEPTQNFKSKNVVRARNVISNELPLKILLVEDNEVNIEFATRALKKFGYEATVARDGYEAVNEASKNVYDVVLMDISLPGIDGIEATKQIRNLVPPNSEPYIVAVTANAMPGDEEKYLKAGMQSFMPKPFTLDDIEKELAKISLR